MPNNGPPLIFLHGVTSSWRAWAAIAPGFASQCRVMAFDLRGHGLSSKPDRGYTWAEDYGADIVDFINNHMEVLPWLYLKGISTGGMQEALEALLGQEAKGLFPASISRLKAVPLDLVADKRQSGRQRGRSFSSEGLR